MCAYRKLNGQTGESRTKLYALWHSMRCRCGHKCYKYYGAKGIKVCEEWENSYRNFRDWALAQGISDEMLGRHKLTLDRIDSNKDYSPQNCRFVDMKTQGNNRSNNKRYVYEGRLLSFTEISLTAKIKPNVLSMRIVRTGVMPGEDITELVKRKLNKRYK